MKKLSANRVTQEALGERGSDIGGKHAAGIDRWKQQHKDKWLYLPVNKQGIIKSQCPGQEGIHRD